MFAVFLSLRKAKRNNMTMTKASESKKRDKARNLYLETGSIKRTAKKMNESKSAVRRWIKDLIELNPSNSRNAHKLRRYDKRNSTKPATTPSSPQPAIKDPQGYSGTIHSKSRTDQRSKNPNKIITSDKGTFEVDTSETWGMFLVPVEDPRKRELSLQEVNGIRLPKTFCKIPAELWISWIDLCFHYCPEKKSPDAELEVQTLLCIKEGDPSQWRMLVPNQTVSEVSVQSEVSDCIDLMTGERFDYFPPVGWMHAGSSHSHNTMKSFFSSTDDEFELSVPGIHIVVGDIDKKRGTYTYKPSIVVRKLRKHIDFHDIVNSDADHVPENISFHPDVLKYVYKKSFLAKSGPSMNRNYRASVTRPRFADDDDDEDLQLDYSGFTSSPSRKTPSNPWPNKIELGPDQDFIDDEIYLG